MLEKEIVTAIMKYLNTVPRCFAWKTHGGMYGRAGLPDIIACFNGRFVAFEVKTETGKPTKLQESTIAKINAAKGDARKVTSVNEVREILKNLRTQTLG
jgi:Holliday junction resolvase